MLQTVAWSVCLSVCDDRDAVWTADSCARNHVLHEGRDPPKGMGNFGG